MRVLTVFALFLLHLCCIYSYLDVNVTTVGYNYAVDVLIDETTFLSIIDTGNNYLTTRDPNYILPDNFTKYDYAFCLYLTIDGTIAEFVEIDAQRCPITTNMTSISSATANVSVRFGEYLGLANPYLHQWNLTNANLGLSYLCTSLQCYSTPFQEILSAAGGESEENGTFGLDFRDPSSPLLSLRSPSSSIQLGGLLPNYSSSIYWYQQAIVTPPYHQLFIAEMELCGAPLFGNYSSNWQVLVDTGAVCLTLPGEIYDNFAAWFDNSTVVNSFADLPALSFRVFGHSSPLYLPLGTLIVNTSAILDEPGAPTVYSATEGEARVCVLRGTTIKNDFGDYVVPVPQISFGSMALRAFYLAANFRNVSLGLATKLSADEIAYYSDVSNPSCAAVVECEGEQGYVPSDNSCDIPACKKYYFQVTNADQTGCTYDAGAVGFGVFFIAVIALMEVVSYFLAQYTAHSLLLARQNTSVQVDSITLAIGRYLSYVADAMAMQLFKGEDRRNRRLADDRDALLHAP